MYFTLNKIGSELSKMFLFQLKVETYLGVRTVLPKKKLQLTKVAVGGAAEELHRRCAKTQSTTSVLGSEAETTVIRRLVVC